jgi:hypothetical protein
MQRLLDLKEIWVTRQGKMNAEGDVAAIDPLLGSLDQVIDRDSGWAILYRHRDTGEFWELTHPQSEMHGVDKDDCDGST